MSAFLDQFTPMQPSCNTRPNSWTEVALFLEESSYAFKILYNYFNRKMILTTIRRNTKDTFFFKKITSFNIIIAIFSEYP